MTPPPGSALATSTFSNALYLLIILPRPLRNTAPPTPVILYPESTSRSVDFPAPDGPMMATNCLGLRRPWTPWRICLYPENNKNIFG